jgi:hypothetical protein
MWKNKQHESILVNYTFICQNIQGVEYVKIHGENFFTPRNIIFESIS